MRLILLCLLLCLSLPLLAAKTFITKAEIDVFDLPNGVIIESWPDRTLFTSSEQDEEWIEVTGHFPEGEWQPLEPHLYVSIKAALEERTVVSHSAPPMIIHKALKSRNTKAKAYKLLESTLWYPDQQSALSAALKQKNKTELEPDSATDADFEDSVNNYESSTQTGGEILLADSVFTTNEEDHHTIRITGHFPDGAWQPVSEPMWLAKPVKVQNRTRPKMYERDANAKRVAVIDKTSFNVSVFEIIDGQSTKLVTAPVALGYDRCLSAAKGGKCYYTPEGQFEIEFKLFDPDGINWCVPKKMEGEFRQKLAKGERCWRGIMGNHAMHFGNSLFLHGTSNPRSIGSRTTHGCVRLRNSDIEVFFRLLQNGDKVIVSATPEELDLVALTNTQSDLENKPLADNKVSESGIENLTEQERNTVSNGELTGQEDDTYGDETTSSDNTSITGSKVTEQPEINPFDIDIQEVKQPSVESSEDEKRQIGIAEIEADPAL
ncbi:L,D-transpeptidase [Psychrosphaera sp. 1_MG-2023]|uniref:L,D-transpeptidase n=1 Tax=Psychrosphaera sp. 1_MG-2023 TaxID=3062643 RepID=UPI0026E15743|nr:L,D-transpeptidase [Psychrosphaera sp. 1_MG-2023]MDO6719231.1 L,D-transpeptidase [Psychrosphaera sp. 1_MG-2023]